MLNEPGPFEGWEGSQPLEFVWMPREALHTIDLRPAPLVQWLAQPDLPFLHLTVKEDAA